MSRSIQLTTHQLSMLLVTSRSSKMLLSRQSYLSGITDGPNESQPLRIIATSSNALVLIADPVVTYASPDATGSIAFTPVTDQYGTATITVTAEDPGADGDFNTTEDNLTVSRSFDVTVTPVNDAPVLDSFGIPVTSYDFRRYWCTKWTGGHTCFRSYRYRWLTEQLL